MNYKKDFEEFLKQELEKELEAVNKKIDTKIKKGQTYKKEQKDHTLLVEALIK